MNRTIVVGVDHSGPSQGALDWAVRRADRLRLDVALVHVVNDYWVRQEYDYYERIMNSATELLEKTEARARAISPSVKIRAELHHGSVTGTLSERSKDAVLVVVGTDKRGRIEGELFGSVSLQIAALSHAPVAVIPLVPEAG
ncbi:MAG TPA: universal stress protein, partial [Micrococcaceae bacterium]